MSSPIAHIHDPGRRSEWIAVLGTDQIPVKSLFPSRAILPDNESALVYKIDIDALNSDQLQRLVHHLADKFQLDIDQVRAEVINGGVPILANNVTVTGFAQWWL